jgi:ABC-type multidrug transport system fused ATPase/permease subunit
MDVGIIRWAFERAWEIDKKNLLFWTVITVTGAFLPVLFLIVTREIIDIITEQTSGMGSFGHIILWISALIGFLFFKHNL